MEPFWKLWVIRFFFVLAAMGIGYMLGRSEKK